MVSIEGIEQKLKKAGMPTDHADAVFQLISYGDISWEEFEETLPSLKDADLDEGIKNQGFSTITDDEAIKAKLTDQTNELTDWQISKGYTSNTNSRSSFQRRNFREKLDDWITMEWENSEQPSDVCKEEWFLQKYNLRITQESLIKILNGEASPSEELLNKLLENFPDKHKIVGYKVDFAQAAFSIRSITEINVEEKQTKPPFGKQLSILLAIAGIYKTELCSILGYSRRAIANWENGIGISPSKIQKIVKILKTRIPNLREDPIEELYESAKPYFSSVTQIKDFKDSLLHWREMCELSPENFCNDVGKKMHKSYHLSYFQNWANGQGLSANLIDSMADVIEEKMARLECKSLHFNKKEKEEFYNLASKHFPSIDNKNFKELLNGWYKRSGISLNSFLEKVGNIVREDKKPFTQNMFYQWKKGKNLNHKIISAMADVFEEATKNNKSELFRFKPEDRETFIESAQQYIKKPTAKKEKAEPEQEKAEPKKFTFVGMLNDRKATAFPPLVQHPKHLNQTLSQKIARGQAQRELPSGGRLP